MCPCSSASDKGGVPRSVLVLVQVRTAPRHQVEREDRLALGNRRRVRNAATRLGIIPSASDAAPDEVPRAELRQITCAP